MIYIVAILLALILVAMISSNKDARFGVQSFLTILIALLLILAIWMTFAAWNLYFFFENDDSEKTWYFKALSITFSILTPPILLWINKNYLLKLFKNEKKKFFKLLSFFLIGVIGFNSLLLLFHIIKKEAPFFGWALLISASLVTGLILLERTFKRPYNWKSIWFGNDDPYEIASKEYDLFEDDLARRKEAIENARQTLSIEEQDEINERFSEERRNAINKKFALEEKLIKDSDKNYILYIFWWSIIFLVFGFLGYVWDYVLALVMEFEFIKGRVWLACVIIVGTPLALIGLIMSIYEDHFKKLN